MIRFHRIFSTVGGIGYVRRGGGTIAALVCCVCWYIAWNKYPNDLLALILTVCITIAGVWSAGKVEPDWGKDSSRVVIDEISGMAIALILIPVTWRHVLVAFVLFRFFDILKPLYIRRMEKLPGGWGVMMDDVMAGLYSNFIMQLLILFNF